MTVDVNEVQETEDLMDKELKRNSKIIDIFYRTFFVIVLLLFILVLPFFMWKLPVYLQLETIKLPENYTVYKPSKVEFSDVYWEKILGEKVIICSEGYEAAKKYIEENNSEFLLKNIEILYYYRLTDDSVYFAKYDEDFLKIEDDKMDCYISIQYYKKIVGMPWHYFSILFD